MNDSQKALNLLGLSMRAGKLVSGEDTVIRDIRKKTVKLVIVTLDASDNSKKMITDKCKYYGVPYKVAFTQAELSHAIGKNRKIVALKDQGFAKKMNELI